MLVNIPYMEHMGMVNYEPPKSGSDILLKSIDCHELGVGWKMPASRPALVKKTAGFLHLGVSINRGTPKSSILIEVSIINYSAIGVPPFSWKPPISSRIFNSILICNGNITPKIQVAQGRPAFWSQGWIPKSGGKILMVLSWFYPLKREMLQS